MDLIKRSFYRFRLRYSLNVHPTSIATTVSDISSGGRCRQSSDCYSTTDWKIRRSGQTSFSKKNEIEMDDIEVINHLHKNDSKKINETSFLMEE